MSEMIMLNNRIITALTVVVYVLTQNVLTAAKVFPVFSLLHILSGSLLKEIPWAIKDWLEVGVSTKRIQVGYQ